MLEKHAPALLQNLAGPAAGRTLVASARFNPQLLTPAVLDAISAELGRIPKR